ncbi:MAG: tetratricopeptide repeat protein [Candidatus Eisenbacteria bacterium]
MTKEELREDPVLERIQKLVDFSAHNSRWLIGAAIVVVAVIVAVSALHRSQIRGQREAARYLSEAQASYMRGNLPAAESQLRQLVDGYGGTPAGSMGRVYLGDVLRALARPEEALKLYADAEKGSAVQQTAALRGRAAALEDLGRFAEASEAYERASAVAPFLQGEDLIGAGRTAIKAGQAARAKELLEKARGLVQGERQSELALLLAQAEAQTP